MMKNNKVKLWKSNLLIIQQVAFLCKKLFLCTFSKHDTQQPIFIYKVISLQYNILCTNHPTTFMEERNDPENKSFVIGGTGC